MLEYFITNYGNQIIMAVMCGIFGMLGYAAKRLCARYINDDAKRTAARLAVQFVEQVYKEFHGKDKLAAALETAAELLKKKGIDFDAAEMKILIEAAVAEFNQEYRKPIEAPDTARAVYRVEPGCIE